MDAPLHTRHTAGGPYHAPGPQSAYGPPHGAVPPAPGADVAGDADRGLITRVATVVVPGALAWRMFRPHHVIGEPDPVMERLNRLRALVGLGLVAAAYLRVVGGDQHALQTFVQQDGLVVFVRRTIGVPVLGAAGVALFGALLFAATRPDRRHLTLRHLAYPAVRIGMFAVVPAAGLGLCLGLRSKAGVDGYRLLQVDGSGTDLAMTWVGSVVGVWTLGFVLIALYLVSEHLFAAADAHPMLPALLATWMAWGFTADDLWLHLAGDGSNVLSNQVQTLLTTGGALTVTALSGYELYRLHRWDGINPRSGPWGTRTPEPCASPWALTPPRPPHRDDS